MQSTGCRPRVLLLLTGGTITMHTDSDGHLAPGPDAQQLIKRIPELSQIADIECISLGDFDSSNLQPEFWKEAARAIYERYQAFNGFVLSHGTDTMVYTASALSFFLQELGKPVVITGAQIPLSEIGSDGRANLVNAVRVATSDLAEVCIVFGSQVIRGTRAKKISAFDLSAFTSINAAPLATIGLTIRIEPHYRRRAPQRRPLFQPTLCAEVARIPVYPGIRPELITSLAASHAGLVIEGYGVGNLPSAERSLIPPIREAVARNVPVVICTQCVVGSTAMELYQVGQGALDAGAIPAMDMTPETTQVKLMWALGQTRDLETVESIMMKNFVGEIHGHMP